MSMNGKRGHEGQSARGERLARIFLKPQAGRYIGAIRIIDALLSPLQRLFSPRPWDKTRGVGNILVFDPGALGDMMLLVPFLRKLRASFPMSWIVLAGRTGAGDLLLHQRIVDEWVSLEIPWALRETSRFQRNQPFSTLWWKFILELFQLRERRFDLGFAAGWGGDIRGNLAIWLAGASRRVGYGYGGGESLLTDAVEPDLRRPHVADRNLQLLEHLGIQTSAQHSFAETQDRAAPLQISAEEAGEAEEFLAFHDVAEKDLLIGVHPGAGSPIREWGDERFAEVAKRAAIEFGAKILWLNDPNKPKPVPAGLQVVEVAVSIRQLLPILSRCRLLLCNDGGAMHVAGALNVPVVTVFGPTQAEWFGPYGDGHRLVIRNDIWCRPCADRCRWKEPYCLRLITVEEVMDAVRDVVKNIVSIRGGVGVNE